MDTNVLQTLKTLKTFIEVAEIYAFGSREIREAATLLLDRQAILRLSPGTLNPTKPFHRLPDEIQTRKADDPLTQEVKNAAGIVGFLRTGKRTAQGIRYATENRVEQSNLTDEEIKTVMVERLRRIVGIIERYLRAPGEEEEQVGEAQSDGGSELDSQDTTENSRTNFVLFDPLTEDSLNDLVKRVAFELHAKSDQIKRGEVKEIEIIRSHCKGKKEEERLRSELNRAVKAGKINPIWK